MRLVYGKGKKKATIAPTYSIYLPNIIVSFQLSNLLREINDLRDRTHTRARIHNT